MSRSQPTLTWPWHAALACFIVAGSTGALLRSAMLNGPPWGLSLQNIRHAHSHLMYFGWVTPALMALILANVSQRTGCSPGRTSRHILVSVFVAALIAYPAFLLFSYRSAQVGSVQLPLATMAAGLNVFTWYAFIAHYRAQTRGLTRYLPLRLWDAALAFLFLSSLGAWGLALASFVRIDSPLVSMALTRLFLDLFADGWFLLALFGLAFASSPLAPAHGTARVGENLLVIGLPLTFLLSVPSGSLPPAVRALTSFSAVLAAIGLLFIVAAFARTHAETLEEGQRWLWRVSLFFLTLRALAFLVVSTPSGVSWSLRMGLRVSYLHWLLLGGISMGLLAAARYHWGPWAARHWREYSLSIMILLSSLLPLTQLWPAALRGRWALEAAAWAALGPAVVALIMLIDMLRSKAERPTTATETVATQLTSDRNL